MTGLRKLTLLFLPILLFISGCKSNENNPVESTGNENVFIQYEIRFRAVHETKNIVMYENSEGTQISLSKYEYLILLRTV